MTARRNQGNPGFKTLDVTVVEFFAVAAVVCVLTVLARPGLAMMVGRSKVARAIADIQAIEIDIADFEIAHDSLPSSLDAVGHGTTLDPWGHPYRYLTRQQPGGATRIDAHQRPLNLDYDLYSAGADGTSAPELTASSSRDDVIRAEEGAFVGPARERQ